MAYFEQTVMFMKVYNINNYKQNQTNRQVGGKTTADLM